MAVEWLGCVLDERGYLLDDKQLFRLAEVNPAILVQSLKEMNAIIWDLARTIGQETARPGETVEENAQWAVNGARTTQLREVLSYLKED